MKLFILLTYISAFVVFINTKTIDIDNSNLIKRDHDTCDPKSFGGINRQYAVSYLNLPNGELINIYECNLEHDGTKIKCKADRPMMRDDEVTFKVKRSTAYQCTRELCNQGNAKRENFIFDKNGNIRGTTREKKINVGDHFCYRYTYNGKKM